MKEPTGQEHLTPVKIKQISVTERAQFRKCRRRWFLNDVHRLEGAVDSMFLKFGTAMHAALAVYHETVPEERDLDLILNAFTIAWEEEMATAQGKLGFLWQYAEEEWLAHSELAEQMLAGYVEADRNAAFDYPPIGETLETEKRYTVRIPGTTGKLTGKLDLVTKIKVGRRGTDHKNLASQHSSAQLDIDDQLTGYAWLYYKATGYALDEVAYNVLLKKGPLTKSGKPTTSKLFTRDITYRGAGQLRQFEAYLAEEWRDMKKVAAKPELAYPNPTVFNCGGCPVRSICVSMMQEEDTSYVIQHEYMVGDEKD